MARFIRTLLRGSLLALAVLASAPASAQTCTVSGGGTINFLIYNPGAASPSRASTTVTLECTPNLGASARKNVNWTMELSNGSSGNCNARTMTGPGTINYNIYQDVAASVVWGNAGCGTFPSGTMLVNSGASNEIVTRTLFGRIPIGQFVSAGTYNDPLQVTIVYN